MFFPHDRRPSTTGTDEISTTSSGYIDGLKKTANVVSTQFRYLFPIITPDPRSSSLDDHKAVASMALESVMLMSSDGIVTEL